MQIPGRHNSVDERHYCDDPTVQDRRWLSDEGYQTFTLSTSSSEYAEVMAFLAATADASQYDVVSVRLVCDPHRFYQYQMQKHTFASYLGAAKLSERWLWHGTGESLVVPILTNGFLRDHSTTAVYGDGTYFF